MSAEERGKMSVHVLERVEFDWTGKEGLFVQLLKLRDTQVASVLFGSACPPDLTNLGNLEIGPIDWWLEWMMKLGSTSVDHWLLNQLGALFAGHLNREVQDEFVAEFNNSDSKFRRLLLRFVLPYFKNITTDVFSEDAISFLLADLSRRGSIPDYGESLLGNTATANFITERLLPLLADAQRPLSMNLQKVLRQAGTRHGRRYVLG
jgi:hypothetical protein